MSQDCSGADVDVDVDEYPVELFLVDAARSFDLPLWHGVACGAHAPADLLFLGPVAGSRAGKRIRVLAVRLGAKHAAPLAKLCREGTVTIHIDRRFRLEEAPETLAYIGECHARGKVVVVVDNEKTGGLTR